MTPDRRARLWAQVDHEAGDEPVAVEHVCRLLIEVAGVDGVAVSLVAGRASPEPVWASDDLAARVAELTVTLGEGPAHDIVAGGGPVLAPDLVDPAWRRRWPGFTLAVAELDVRAVLALPLQVGTVRLGVLLLHRAEPGGIDGDRLTNVLVLADSITLLLLDRVEGGGRSLPGREAAWRADGFSSQVHQATGMIIVQLGVSAEVAFSRLRAHAYAQGRRLGDVAEDVVARRLRFAKERPGDYEDEGAAT